LFARFCRFPIQPSQSFGLAGKLGMTEKK